MAGEAHGRADLKLLLAEYEAGLMALAEDLRDAEEEDIPGGGLEEDIVDQLENPWQAGEGGVTTLTPPIARRAQPHQDHAIVESSLREQEGGQFLAAGRQGHLEVVPMKGVELRKPPGAGRDALYNGIGGGEGVDQQLDVGVQRREVGNQSDAPHPASQHPAEVVGDFVGAKAAKDALVQEVLDEGVGLVLHVEGHGTGRVDLRQQRRGVVDELDLHGVAPEPHGGVECI